jgi:hypothetical protein
MTINNSLFFAKTSSEHLKDKIESTFDEIDLEKNLSPQNKYS